MESIKSPANSQLKLSDLIEGYLRSCKSSGLLAQTVSDYRRILTDFLIWHTEHSGAQFPPASIMPETVLKFASRNSASVVTIRNRSSIVRRMLLWCHDAGLIPQPAIRALKPPRGIRKRNRDVLTPGEMERVRDRLFDDRDDSRSKRMERLCYELALLGLRHGGIRCLRWDHVKPNRFTVRVKGGGHRIYNIDPDLRKAFDRVKEVSSTEWVFSARKNVEPNPYVITRLFRNLLEKAGVFRDDYRGPHLWRHSVATLLYKQTKDLERVRQYLGHQFTETTQRYIHLSKDDTSRSLETIKEILGKEK